MQPHSWLALGTAPLFLILLSIRPISCTISYAEVRSLREEVREMFYHGFNNYMTKAYPFDELKPLSCEPRNPQKEPRGTLDDTLGNFSLTLVDSLDTLAIFGDWPGFESGLRLIVDNLSFDSDVTVSVFETTIRVLGGLLSVHQIAVENPLKLNMTYRGEVLRKAIDLGQRLMPAFRTSTGIPYSRINLRRGVLPGETVETCTAGAGTLLVEFGALSRMSGNYEFEDAARNAAMQLWNRRSHLDLMGNVIDVQSGKWVRGTASIGAGIDSFYEYLLKSYIAFGDDEMFSVFNRSYHAVERHVKRDGWYLEVNMRNGQLTRDWVDSLQAFWPALQVLMGEVEAARESHGLLHAIWSSQRLIPEGFHPRAHRVLPSAPGYPLRPEFAESTLFLYQATKDPRYLEVGREIVWSLQNFTRVPCGFAAVADVETKRLEDRMDSYFLTETLKYLYLLFDPDNEYNRRVDFLFSTEGHPLPLFRPRPRVTKKNATILPPSNAQCQAVPALPQFAELEWDIGEDEALPMDDVLDELCYAGPDADNFATQESLPVVNVRIGNPLLHAMTGDLPGTPASFGTTFNVTGVVGKLVWAKPRVACSPLTNAADMAGGVALVDRGDCFFLQKVRHAEQAGAVAVVVANDRPGELFTMSTDANDPHERFNVSIPSVLIGLRDSFALKEHANRLMGVAVFAQEPYEFVVRAPPPPPMPHTFVVNWPNYMTVGSIDGMAYLQHQLQQQFGLRTVVFGESNVRPSVAAFGAPPQQQQMTAGQPQRGLSGTQAPLEGRWVVTVPVSGQPAAAAPSATASASAATPSGAATRGPGAQRTGPPFPAGYAGVPSAEQLERQLQAERSAAARRASDQEKARARAELAERRRQEAAEVEAAEARRRVELNERAQKNQEKAERSQRRLDEAAARQAARLAEKEAAQREAAAKPATGTAAKPESTARKASSPMPNAPPAGSKPQKPAPSGKPAATAAKPGEQQRTQPQQQQQPPRASPPSSSAAANADVKPQAREKTTTKLPPAPPKRAGKSGGGRSEP